MLSSFSFKVKKSMVIVAKQRVPQCAMNIIIQAQICGTTHTRLKKNSELMFYCENFKQLCKIEPINDDDLKTISVNLSKTNNENWPENLLSSKKNIFEFISKERPKEFKKAINQIELNNINLLEDEYDYENNKKVHIVHNKAVKLLIKSICSTII